MLHEGKSFGIPHAAYGEIQTPVLSSAPVDENFEPVVEGGYTTGLDDALDQIDTISTTESRETG